MRHAVIIVVFVPHRAGLCLKYCRSELNGKAKEKREKRKEKREKRKERPLCAVGIYFFFLTLRYKTPSTGGAPTR
jgi:hypothetical protein